MATAGRGGWQTCSPSYVSVVEADFTEVDDETRRKEAADAKARHSPHGVAMGSFVGVKACFQGGHAR
jgi:hypothetical protein